MGCFFPNHVLAQYGGFDQEDTGFGLWFNIESLSLDPPTDRTNDQDTAYLEVLPSSLVSVGLGGGYSFNDFGFSLGYSRGDASVGQDADVQQNDDTSDDLEVKTAIRINQTWSIQYNVVYPLYFGIGGDQGTFEFNVITPSGGDQVRITGYYNPFLIFGLVVDSELSTFTLLSNVYIKVPYEATSYSGTVIGVALTGVLN